MSLIKIVNMSLIVNKSEIMLGGRVA